MNWRWISEATIKAVHNRSLAEHGGATGIRDKGMLSSALARPEQLAHYDEPDVFALAASYAYGLIKNHPFVDGNKRTAFAAAFIFLARNGYRFEGSEISVVEKTLGLAASAVCEDDFAEWLRINSKKF